MPTEQTLHRTDGTTIAAGTATRLQKAVRPVGEQMTCQELRRVHNRGCWNVPQHLDFCDANQEGEFPPALTKQRGVHPQITQ